ncbi:MAG: hypothetical protein O3B42_04175 [Actinomycetota bacterium]|nr:hypothetical protein [Actinomycetota bacterium]
MNLRRISTITGHSLPLVPGLTHSEIAPATPRCRQPSVLRAESSTATLPLSIRSKAEVRAPVDELGVTSREVAAINPDKVTTAGGRTRRDITWL